MEDIGDQNWDCAHRLFQCVAAASRPLRVKELAEFLAFDFETRSTPTFLADWRPEDPENTVISTCSSLLAVVNVDGSPVIQFAHFSVKEYLTSARLTEAKNTICRFHIPMTTAHTVVARACLGVLLHFGKGVNSVNLTDFPLAEYAAKHWMDHTRFENVSSHVQDGMKRLFDPRKHHLSVWVWISDPIFPPVSSFYRRPFVAPETVRSTPLHYAVSLGLHDVAAFLIDEYSQDVNAWDPYTKETLLHVASRKGHAAVVQLLLENGADVMAKNADRYTPLHLAAKYGHVEVAQVLEEWRRGGHQHIPSSFLQAPFILFIQQAVERTLRPSLVDTPLMLALRAGQHDVARVLLEDGAGGHTSIDIEVRRRVYTRLGRWQTRKPQPRHPPEVTMRIRHDFPPSCCRIPMYVLIICIYLYVIFPQI